MKSELPKHGALEHALIGRMGWGSLFITVIIADLYI